MSYPLTSPSNHSSSSHQYTRRWAPTASAPRPEFEGCEAGEAAAHTTGVGGSSSVGPVMCAGSTSCTVTSDHIRNSAGLQLCTACVGIQNVHLHHTGFLSVTGGLLLRETMMCIHQLLQRGWFHRLSWVHALHVHVQAIGVRDDSTMCRRTTGRTTHYSTHLFRWLKQLCPQPQRAPLAHQAPQRR